MEKQATGTVLITGASSGIGAAFASALARQGHNLILLGRRKERLAALTAELRQQAVRAEYLIADLSIADELQCLEHYIRELPSLELLVNDAGFGTMGSFMSSDITKQLEMVQVHIVATMRLCRAALPGMIARNRGAIINVASIGAFLPAIGNVTYNATKAFLVSFSQSLQKELLGTDIQVQALCPGFTLTEFHDRPEYADLDRSQIPQWLWSSPSQVVSASLAALKRKQVICIPGFKNRVLIAMYRNRVVHYLLEARSEAIVNKATRQHHVP